MRVTFDSQVVGKVACPERRRKDPDHAHLEKINTALQERRLQGFLCESIGTLEPIKKAMRGRYFASRIPKSDVQMLSEGGKTSVHITIKMDHELHPGLHRRLVQRLRQARALGMRLLYVPTVNIQLPGEFRNDQEFYESRLFETQSYADRFWEIATAIDARGGGIAAVTAIVNSFQGRLPAGSTGSPTGMRLLAYARNDDERDRIAKAVAEWADGDLVACHIASGNDWLCTEDRGRSAGCPSIFDDCNRNWLRATYSANIVSVRELAAQLDQPAQAIR